MKSFLTWASSIGLFLFLLVYLLSSIAHDRLKGFPDDPEKNVSLVPSSPPPGDVALTLQPPMETRQMLGQSQELALQFFNRSKEMIEVLPERVEPSECFSLKVTDPQSVDKPLQPNETRVKMDRLSFVAACVGEEHPLTLIYRWKILGPPMAPIAARRTKKGRRKHLAALPPLIEERSISTTPIRITSKDLNVMERFFRIGKLVLLPVLLAILTFSFQRIQAARDEAQNAENLKVEVWKTIHPSFLKMVKRYYSPVLRRMEGMKGHIEKKGSAAELLVLMLALRRQILVLLEKDAGWYFQSKPGEDIVGLLSNAMLNHWRNAIPDFDRTVLILPTGAETLQVATQLLKESDIDLVRNSQFLDTQLGKQQEETLNFFHESLSLFILVLAFEVDRPFYPVWYEKGFPPKVELESLTSELDWYPYPEANRKELRDDLEAYRRSIPWSCVSDKTFVERIRRIRSTFSL